MKTILITGSTDGIGKLAALKLAKDGNEIYLHGRDSKKLESVISEIKTKSNNDKIKGFIADLSDLNAVKQLAEQITNDVSKIDVLINNAGIFKSPKDITKDGLDIRFAVNYFAPFILTKRLLPLIHRGTESRIINLSSAAQAPVSSAALLGMEKLNVQAAYAQSKLALTMWSFYLAKPVKGIVVIAVNPGSLLNTRMANEAYGQYWSPADKGANILYDLAISDEYKNQTGKYFDNDKGDVKGNFAQAHLDAYNVEFIEKLISDTEKLISQLESFE